MSCGAPSCPAVRYQSAVLLLHSHPLSLTLGLFASLPRLPSMLPSLPSDIPGHNLTHPMDKFGPPVIQRIVTITLHLYVFMLVKNINYWWSCTLTLPDINCLMFYIYHHLWTSRVRFPDRTFTRLTFDPLVVVAGPEGDDPLNEEAGYEVQKVFLLSPSLHNMNNNKKILIRPLIRIRDVYPGSWILSIAESRIQQRQKKRRGKN